jgi:hypothetical protein
LIMQDLITHWHIQTTHYPGAPEYGQEGARYIYLTGCALQLDSFKNNEYRLTQYEKQLDNVTCKICKLWAERYLKHRIYLP